MLPILNVSNSKSKKYVVSFQGINYGEDPRDGEFSETLNVSTAQFPCVSQRFGRKVAGTYTAPSTVHTKDGLLVVDGRSLLYNGNVVGSVENGRKQMATVGNYVLIFPDKAFYNVETGEFGNMENKVITTGDATSGFVETRTVCNSNEFLGSTNNGIRPFVYADSVSIDQTSGAVSISGTAAQWDMIEDVMLRGKYIKFNDSSAIFYVHTDAELDWEEWDEDLDGEIVWYAAYSLSAGSYSLVSSRSAAALQFTDSTITTTGDDWTFRVGDAVTIEGCTSIPENNKTIIVRGVSGKVMTFYENSFKAGEERGIVTLKRDVPDLDYVCESNNRLWGTKGNTIYGSKYGDPFNFQNFDGLTGDSYYIDVGSDGEFTGCAPFSSHVCFFKENTLHKLYGSKPSNFQIVTSQVYGVQAGSERSICCINETLFYKGVSGVYAYAGGVPELVSSKFGMRKYGDACAATDGTRYYISMREGSEWHVFVYDVQRNLWVHEDNTHCVDMTFHEGCVYFLTADGKLLQVDSDADRSDVEWSVTFCPFNETVNERKGYSKFHLRLDLEAGSSLTVEIKRNTDYEWKQVYTTHNERARTISIPVIPARCDSVEIRLSGKGECLLRTFVREFFTGSDV